MQSFIFKQQEAFNISLYKKDLYEADSDRRGENFKNLRIKLSIYSSETKVYYVTTIIKEILDTSMLGTNEAVA